MKKHFPPATCVNDSDSTCKSKEYHSPASSNPSPLPATVILAIALAAAFAVAVIIIADTDSILGVDQFADANTLKKVHFTQTLSSSPDPSMSGAGNRHVGFVLSPNEGTIYDGSMTFTASGPVEVLILHALTADDLEKTADTDLMIWTVDGQTQYGIICYWSCS